MFDKWINLSIYLLDHLGSDSNCSLPTDFDFLWLLNDLVVPTAVLALDRLGSDLICTLPTNFDLLWLVRGAVGVVIIDFILGFVTVFPALFSTGRVVETVIISWDNYFVSHRLKIFFFSADYWRIIYVCNDIEWLMYNLSMTFGNKLGIK